MPRPTSPDPTPAQARPPRRLGPVDTGAERPLPGLAGLLARCLVFGVALAATLFLLQRLAAPGGHDLIGSKRQVFGRRAGQVDTLLLGSSHVYRGIVPAQLDERLAAQGIASQTFNYGIQLPNLIELRYILREALAQARAAGGQDGGQDGGLKRVVLEYLRLVPQVDPQNAFVPRSIYWHDLEQTRLASERVAYWAGELEAFSFVERTEPARGPEGGEVLRRAQSTTGFLDRALPDPLRARRDHGLHWLARLAMVGRHEDLARGVLGRDHALVSWVAPASGYVSLEDEAARLDAFGVRDNTYTRRNLEFRASLDAYAERVERLRTEPRVFGDEEWMNSALQQVDDLEVLRHMRDDCRELGAELVLVFMPSNSTDRELEARIEEQLEIPVLLYTDPDLYPSLYDPALRFDSGHFNVEGARAFTDVLAADLAELVAEGRLR